MMFSNLDILKICPREIEIDSATWEYKQSLEELKIKRNATVYTFSSQYQQKPTSSTGEMFKSKYWKYYEVLPADINIIYIYGDTAQKTGEQNDYSVFQVWGKSSSGVYLIDQCRGKWEAPQLESVLVAFWEKHKRTPFKIKGAMGVKIEDKSSGSSLIQSIRQNYNIPINGIQRSKDKIFRAMGVINYFAQGYIHLPKNVEWLHDYTEEFRKFNVRMTHKHDDQIDPTVDAVEDLLIFNNNNVWTKEALGIQ